MSRFARNTAFSSLAGLSTALGSMVSAILVARMLGPAGSGVVIFGLWIVATTAALSDGGLSATLARFIPELIGKGQQEQVPNLVYHVARLAIGLAIGVPCVVGGLLLLSGAWFPRTDMLDTFGLSGSVVLLALCAAQTLSNLYLYTLRGMQRFDEVARLVFASMLAQLALVIAGAVWFGPTGAFAGYLAGSIGPAFLSFRLLRKSERAPRDLRIRVRRYTLFTWAANLTSLLVWSRIEIVFLKHSFGDEAVGMFSVGLTLASLAVQGPLLFTGGLLAYFSERSGSESHAEVETALNMGTRLMAVIILPLSFGLCALAPRLIPLLYGPGFEAAAPAAMILITATAFGAIGSVGTNLVFSRERSDVIFYCNVGGGLLALAGGFLIIPIFGLVGAALLRAVIQCAMLAAGWTFIAKRLYFRPPLRQVGLLVAAAAICGFAAHLTLAAIPGLGGLALAVVAGAVVYLAALRLLGGLPRGDLSALQGALSRAPRAVRTSMSWLLRLLGHPSEPSGALTLTGRATP